MEIPKQDLAIYTFGNASAFDADRGVFAIKPSGVPYDKLTPEHMVIVDLDGNVVEGDLKPSSDTASHLYIYRHMSQVNGVVHTHSNYKAIYRLFLRNRYLLYDIETKYKKNSQNGDRAKLISG
jgi:L-ribulose-5-phosphate 4-epimerase